MSHRLMRIATLAMIASWAIAVSGSTAFSQVTKVKPLEQPPKSLSHSTTLTVNQARSKSVLKQRSRSTGFLHASRWSAWL
jgi:hypothetical protein